MKVKTNVHAGSGGNNQVGSQQQQQQHLSKSSILQALYTYIPAISRCVGI